MCDEGHIDLSAAALKLGFTESPRDHKGMVAKVASSSQKRNEPQPQREKRHWVRTSSEKQANEAQQKKEAQDQEGNVHMLASKQHKESQKKEEQQHAKSVANVRKDASKQSKYHHVYEAMRKKMLKKRAVERLTHSQEVHYSRSTKREAAPKSSDKRAAHLPSGKPPRASKKSTALLKPVGKALRASKKSTALKQQHKVLIKLSHPAQRQHHHHHHHWHQEASARPSEQKQVHGKAMLLQKSSEDPRAKELMAKTDTEVSEGASEEEQAKEAAKEMKSLEEEVQSARKKNAQANQEADSASKAREKALQETKAKNDRLLQTPVFMSPEEKAKAKSGASCVATNAALTVLGAFLTLAMA